MRLDGLSSTALNRGLQLHESQALFFLFTPFSFALPFISSSRVAAAAVWRACASYLGVQRENKAGRQRYMSSGLLLQHPLSHHTIKAEAPFLDGRGCSEGEIHILLCTSHLRLNSWPPPAVPVMFSVLSSRSLQGE